MKSEDNNAASSRFEAVGPSDWPQRPPDDPGPGPETTMTLPRGRSTWRAAATYFAIAWAMATFWTLVVVLLVLAATAAPAGAHSWYPWRCCSDRDCAALADGAVSEVAGGFAVKITPGAHPMVRETAFEAVIPFSRWEPSPDGKFHLCLDEKRTVLCAFAPPPGA